MFAVALLLMTGCSSTSGKTAQGWGTPLEVERKTEVMPALGGVETGGLACSQCGCVHFEALSDNGSVCRMCDHGLSNHTRH